MCICIRRMALLDFCIIQVQCTSRQHLHTYMLIFLLYSLNFDIYIYMPYVRYVYIHVYTCVCIFICICGIDRDRHRHTCSAPGVSICIRVCLYSCSVYICSTCMWVCIYLYINLYMYNGIDSCLRRHTLWTSYSSVCILFNFLVSFILE